MSQYRVWSFMERLCHDPLATTKSGVCILNSFFLNYAVSTLSRWLLTAGGAILDKPNVNWSASTFVCWRLSMVIAPLHDKVVVQRLEEKEQVRGGIVIPDTAKEKPLQGKVIAVGKGKILSDGRRRPIGVSAGDRILFSKYAGNEIKMNDQEFLILSEDEILAVID
jgi:chaperonin GroES